MLAVRAIPNATAGSIEEHLAALPGLDTYALRRLWDEVFPDLPRSSLRRKLLIPLLAYRLQERAYGGLSNTARRRLRQFADGLKTDSEPKKTALPRLKPGTRLLRQWRGTVYTVTVEENGYQYQNRSYQSLSHVTRLITGTRWSGPLFFGLKDRPPGIDSKKR